MQYADAPSRIREWPSYSEFGLIMRIAESAPRTFGVYTGESGDGMQRGARIGHAIVPPSNSAEDALWVEQATLQLHASMRLSRAHSRRLIMGALRAMTAWSRSTIMHRGTGRLVVWFRSAIRAHRRQSTLEQARRTSVRHDSAFPVPGMSVLLFNSNTHAAPVRYIVAHAIRTPHVALADGTPGGTAPAMRTGILELVCAR